MHDLVHDLARSVMADEVLDASKKGNIGGNCCRYALLADCSKPLNLSVASPAKIRALCFMQCGKIELRDAALSSAKHLRVLDLSECKIRKLPRSIARLKQLRYLNAPRIHDPSFPKCITKLSKLNYLNLRGSEISTLPESIGGMEGLIYLDLSYCRRIKKLPKSFVELKDLVHLDLSYCRHVEEGIPEALGVLTKLQYLNLSHCGVGLHLRGLPEVIVSLTKLQYLYLSECMNFICNTSTEQYDTFYLGNSSTDEYDSFIDRISTLSNLEHLDLSNNEHLGHIPESVGKLKKLRTLDLSGCRRLSRLPESLAKMDSLKVLISDELEISRLENVKSAQEAQSIKLMEKQIIKILKLSWDMEKPERFVEDIEVLGELVPPSTLERFEIRGYNSVSFPAWLMGITHYLPNIKSIVMCRLPRCCSLPPLGQLPNLRELDLMSMDSVTKIDERFCGGARAFPRLKSFMLASMESLKEWNTTYSYGEDGVSEFMFPNLERLHISRCPKLRLKPCPPRVTESWVIGDGSEEVISSWAEDVSHTGASPSSALVKELVVAFCDVPLHQWRLLHHLPVVHGLTINRCSDLTSSPEIIRDLSSLESLALWSFEAELPKWLGELTSLQQLDISFSGLKGLQEITRQLTSLQRLSLSDCKRMTSQPHWLGELTSLKKLEIHGCEGIKSLPESIRQLTNLEELRISGCPELKRWCETKENKKTLVHIQEKYIVNYIPLNTLRTPVEA